MKLFERFTQKAPNKVFISIFLGAVAGIGYSALIPLVLISVAPQDTALMQVEAAPDIILGLEVAQLKLASVFFFACILILFVRTISEVMLLRVATLVSKDFRMEFYKRISSAPIAALERLGSSKLIASINLDVPRVVMGARVFPGLLVNAVSLIGMLGFLLYLNAEVFKLVILAIVFGVVAYQIPMLVGRKIFTRARDTRDELQEGLRALVYGAKELKLNNEKKKAFFKQILVKHENDVLKDEKLAHTIVNATASFGELLSFLVIGLVSFVFVNYHSITQEELVGVVMALLYLVGPMGIVLNSIPQLTIAFVSVRKIDKLLGDIPEENASDNISSVKDWEKIRFNGVTYQYDSQNDEKGFRVGPIDLEIERGKVSFVIGANGSGKSTLSKLITLHYSPSEGQILFDSNQLEQSTLNSYRQEVCAIYTDFFLFDRVLTEIEESSKSKIEEYLKLLHLSQKVSIKDGRFSTTSLSDGQRKRLALLVAFLEDKSLYLFDEWAADQDPVFKKVFYRQILPELKRKNKAVVVISHDDKYFDVADKLFVMDQGKLDTHLNSNQSDRINQQLIAEYC